MDKSRGIPPYSYRRLDKEFGEIRVLILSPGEFDDEIRFQVQHVPFVVLPRVAPTRISITEVQDTLPEEWKVYETFAGRRYIFEDENGDTCWTHPNLDIDPALYDGPHLLDSYHGTMREEKDCGMIPRMA